MNEREAQIVRQGYAVFPLNDNWPILAYCRPGMPRILQCRNGTEGWWQSLSYCRTGEAIGLARRHAAYIVPTMQAMLDWIEKEKSADVKTEVAK